MNARSKIDMVEATRLTRAGRLVDAMAVLRGLPSARPDDFADHARPSRRMPPILDMEQPSAVTGMSWTLPPLGEARSDDRRKDIGQLQVPEKFQRLLDRLGNLGSARGFEGLVGDPVRRAPISVPEGARFEERSYANEAGSRAYKLYVPSGYNARPFPLVVLLHGCTQSPDDFAAGTRMNELAEELTFLVAYPAQEASANISKCWNWFDASNQHRDRGEPSLIAGITRQIMRDFSIESGRVYIAGLSAGGAAAAIMGSTYPDLYAAIGVHSGLACGAATDVQSAFEAMRHGRPLITRKPAQNNGSSPGVPTIVFHGDRDTVVNPVNGDQIVAQAKATADLRTTVTRGEAPGGMSYTRIVQADESGRSILEQWVLHGAGHAWSGGSSAGSHTEPRGPDASREMMRFFLQHPGAAP
jgi:poly(hydroxyalkanoate) depolymerase family esterase